MDLNSIRAKFNKEQRFEAHFYGQRREVGPYTVRHFANDKARRNFIVWSNLQDAPNIDEAIDQELDELRQTEQALEWKVYCYDFPIDLVERLQKRGLEAEEVEAIMILEFATAPRVLTQPVRHDIRRLTHPDQLQDLLFIMREVWDSDFEWLVPRLSERMEHTYEEHPIYIAYVDNEPAATAWMTFHEGSQFAGLWGGSTRKKFRGQGLYTSLIATRLQEAQARGGVHYFMIDASSMSRPILEKLNFHLIGFSTPCVMQASSTSG